MLSRQHTPLFPSLWKAIPNVANLNSQSSFQMHGVKDVLCMHKAITFLYLVFPVKEFDCVCCIKALKLNNPIAFMTYRCIFQKMGGYFSAGSYICKAVSSTTGIF